MRIAILLLLASVALTAESAASVQYVGGAVPGMTSKSGHLLLTGDRYLISKTKAGGRKVQYQDGEGRKGNKG